MARITIALVPRSAQTRRSVSIRVLNAYVRRARAYGLDATQQLTALRVDPAALNSPDARVPLATFDAIAVWAMQASRDPQFGLRVVEDVSLQSDDWAMYLLTRSPNLGRALEAIVRFSRLTGDGVELRFTNGPTASLAIEVVDAAQRPQRAVRCTLQAWCALLARVGRVLIRPSSPPLAVELPFDDREAVGEYQRVFGVVPQFGAAQARVSWSAEALTRPAVAGDAALHKLLERHAQNIVQDLPDVDDLLAQVRGAIVELVSDGEVTLERVAKRLRTSPRTLQRRLHRDDRQFRDVVEDVRKMLALQYLRESTLSVDQTAYLLGFSTSSAFGRAFRRWHGCSPGQHRAAQSESSLAL
jgi:AraC-like DNA-binding protein